MRKRVALAAPESEEAALVSAPEVLAKGPRVSAHPVQARQALASRRASALEPPV